jgi:hypothetical protein
LANKIGLAARAVRTRLNTMVSKPPKSPEGGLLGKKIK